MNCIVKQVKLLAGLKHVAKNQSSKLHVTYTARFLTKYMDSCVNTFDSERGAKVGGERLCAEWVLKCGGRLRWVGSDDWLTNYMSLPGEEATKHLKIRDIDLSESVVMSLGMRHLFDVTDLSSLKLHSCKYLDNSAIQQLCLVNSPLRYLQISNSKKITDTGLLSLEKLGFLRQLHLQNLPRIMNKQAVYNKLQEALPDCEIIYTDIDV